MDNTAECRCSGSDGYIKPIYTSAARSRVNRKYWRVFHDSCFDESEMFGLIMMFAILHILVSQLFIAKPMIRFAMYVQEATAKNTTDMNALVTCADTAILYDAQEFLLRRFEESSLELRKANMKIQHRRAIGAGLQQLMGMSGYLVILLLGRGWISAGTTTFGELTASFQYRGGMQKSLMMLINSLMNIRTAMAGVKRVNETMRIKSEE